jgi:hypothetical protein
MTYPLVPKTPTNEIILEGGPFDGKILEPPEDATDFVVELIYDVWIYAPIDRTSGNRQVWIGSVQPREFGEQC